MAKVVEIRYYESFDDDFVTSADQEYELPRDYEWIDESPSWKSRESAIRPLGMVVATVYEKVVLRRYFADRSAMSNFAGDSGEGFFVYANHTQPVGDACMAFLLPYPRKASIVVSPANLGIPVVGPLLPYLGALPTPSTMSGLRKFEKAVEKRLSQGRAIVVFPEAHVWPWYTGIRPLDASAFSLPVATGSPVFSATTVYKKAAFGKRPMSKVYIDGPFYPDESLAKKERKEKLRDEVQAAMESRAAESDCEYVRYVPASQAGDMTVHLSTSAGTRCCVKSKLSIETEAGGAS